MIRETRNLTTGEVRINRFAVGRAGGGMRRVGGIIRTGGAKLGKKPVTVKLPKDFLKITDVNLDKKVRDVIKNESRSFDPSIQNTRQFNASINKDLREGRITKRILNVADIVSGGFLTERNINKDQATLNNRVIKFNNKFGGIELSEEDFKKAETEQKFIDSEQAKINKRIDSLATSKRDSIRDWLIKLKLSENSPRLTVAQQEQIVKARLEDKKIQADIIKNKPQINILEGEINKRNKIINNLQGKKDRTLLEDIKLIRNRNLNNTDQTSIAILKHERPQRIIAGTVAIGGARIPSSISQISFVGAQKVGKGGRIVTDIIFRTKKGTMGFARGVSVIKKGKTISVIAGRFGKVSVKLLKGKRRLRGIRSFVGVEKVVSKSAKFTTQQLRRIAKFTQQQKKKGVLRIIRTNIRGLQQAGLGRIRTVKGKKFFHPTIRFPSGKISTKLARGIDIDDFASVAAVLTKKEISLIIGKTITFKGGKAEFIGLIKSLKSGAKLGTFTISQKQQLSKATQKLFSSVAAAVAKAEKSGVATTRALKLAGAVAILSKAKPVSAVVLSRRARVALARTKARQRVVTRVIKPKITSRTQLVAARKKSKMLQKRRQVLITRQRTLQSQINTQRNKTKQITRQKTTQKAKQKAKQKVELVLRQLQTQKQKLQTKQKQITKQILRVPTFVTQIGTPRIIIPFKRKKGIIRKKKPLKKPVQVFDVFGKSRGKFVKLNVKPLTRGDALSKGAFAIDRTTSRTFKIKPKGKSRTPGVLLKGERNYFKRQGFKLREVRIKKGRKFKLKNKYIEKVGHAIDSAGERSGLSIAKLLKQQRKKRKRLTPLKARKILRDRKIRGRALTRKQKVLFRARAGIKKRKITPSQRKVLIKRLVKARRVRMKNLKGGKRK